MPSSPPDAPPPSMPAPASAPGNIPDPVQVQSKPATFSLSLGSLFTNITGVGGILGLIPTLIFNYGAAKLNQSVNQSQFWAVLAFFFSAFYQPYQAFFQLQQPSPSVAAAVLGAARRRR